MNYINNNNYEVNIIRKHENRILDFFDNFSKNLTINIKVLNYNDFKNEYEVYLGKEYNNHVTEFIKNNSKSYLLKLLKNE